MNMAMDESIILTSTLTWFIIEIRGLVINKYCVTYHPTLDKKIYGLRAE